MNSPHRSLAPGYDMALPTMNRGIVAIVCMGLYTLATCWPLVWLLHVLDRGTVDDPVKTLGVFSFYTVTSGFAAWLTLGLWMSRAKESVDERGLAGPSTWKIWLAWFIPIYGLFAPCLVMSDLMVNKRTVWTRLAMVGWWGGWVIAVFVGQISRLVTASGAIGALVWISLVAMVISYLGVVCVVLMISRGLDRPYKVREPFKPDWLGASA